MHRHLAGDGSHGARSRTEFLRGPARCLVQSWMVREPEVVVRREVDHVAPVVAGSRALRAFERARTQQHSISLERGQLLLQELERIGQVHPSAPFGAILIPRRWAPSLSLAV